MLSSAHTVERAKKKAPCGGLPAAVFCCLRCRAGRAGFSLFPMRTRALPCSLGRINKKDPRPLYFAIKFKNSPGQTGAVSVHFANFSLLFFFVSSLVPCFLQRSLALHRCLGRRLGGILPRRTRELRCLLAKFARMEAFSISRCMREPWADDFGVGEDRGLLAAGAGSVFLRLRPKSARRKVCKEKRHRKPCVF